MNAHSLLRVCRSLLAGAATLLFATTTYANPASLPVEYTAGSEMQVNYADWDLILKSSVMMVGKSDRTPAKRIKITATRIKHADTNVTRIEGNRVFFHEFSPAHTTTLIALRKSLEAVSDEISLTELSRNEQLAYWLNLHNVAVMAEIARVYPVKYLKGMVKGNKAVWGKKLMRVGGMPTSIHDIEKHVIANWDDPLVLYGFYMGAVGGPNVLDIAYTGHNVRTLLLENADEFVNSLRGIRLWSGHAKISSLYFQGKRLFPDFNHDVKRHMLRFAKPALRNKISDIRAFRPAAFDWFIADLLNGDGYLGTSYYDNPASLGNFSGYFSFSESAQLLNLPPQARELLIGIRKRNLRRRGRVKIEEVASGTTSEADPPESQQQDSDQPIIY